MTRIPFHPMVPLVLAALLVCLLAGCGPSAADQEKLLAERSPIFATLAKQNDSGALKTRFERRFPELRFKVTAKYPTVNGSSKGREKFETEVSLIVTNPPPNYAAIQPFILNEMEAYLTDALDACEMERDGPIQPTLSKDRKVGFWFGYKSKTGSSKTTAGTLQVDLQQYAAGTTSITIAEEE